MSKEPRIGVYLDDEERELVEAIEADDYVPGPSFLTPERREKMREAARNTINDQSSKSTTTHFLDE